MRHKGRAEYASAGLYAGSFEFSVSNPRGETQARAAARRGLTQHISTLTPFNIAIRAPSVDAVDAAPEVGYWATRLQRPSAAEQASHRLACVFDCRWVCTGALVCCRPNARNSQAVGLLHRRRSLSGRVLRCRTRKAAHVQRHGSPRFRGGRQDEGAPKGRRGNGAFNP